MTWNRYLQWNPTATDVPWEFSIADDPQGSGAAMMIAEPELTMPWDFAPLSGVYGAEQLVGHLQPGAVTFSERFVLEQGPYPTEFDLTASYSLTGEDEGGTPVALEVVAG